MFLFLIVAIIGLIVCVPAFIVWLALAVIQAVAELLMWVVITIIACLWGLVEVTRGNGNRYF